MGSLLQAWMDLARMGPGGLVLAVLVLAVLAIMVLAVLAGALHGYAALRDGYRRGRNLSRQ